MFKKLLSLLLFFITISITAQVPSSGLISHYKFTNGSLNDEVSSGASLTNTAGSLPKSINDRFGSSVSAIENDQSAKIRRSNFTSYQSIGDDHTLSFSFWMKTNTNDGNARNLYDKSNKSNAEFSTSPVSGEKGLAIILKNGKIGVQYIFGRIDNIVSGGRRYIRRTNFSNTNIADDQWHHVTITIRADITSTGSAVYQNTTVFSSSIYVDGILDNSENIGPVLSFDPNISFDEDLSSYLFQVRSASLSSSTYYSDSFDDFAIHNRILSAAEIQNIYRENEDCLIFPTTDFTITRTSNNNVELVINGSGSFNIAYHKSSEPFSNATIISANPSGTTSISGLDPVRYFFYVKNQNCNDPNLGWSEAKISGTSILYVNASAVGNNDGADWTNAYTDIQDALTVALDGEEIWIAKGTYTPDSSDRTNPFTINTENVKIYGGFDGTEISLSARDNSLIHNVNRTILSGDLQGNDNGSIFVNKPDRSDNSYHVVDIRGDNVLLDGVTISGGHANGANDFRLGAAIYITSNIDKFTIRNSRLEENAGVIGGALYSRVSGSSVQNYNVDSCIFKNNVSTNVAAALFATPGDNTSMNFTISNSLFENNRTEDNGSALGRGLSAIWLRAFNTGSVISPTIVNNTFVNNRNEGTGSSDFATVGLSQENGTFGTINIANNIFWGNTDNSGNTSLAFGRRTDSSIAPGISVSNSIDENNFSNIPMGNVINSSNSDPLFTDAVNGDFTLQTVSPAVDSGDNTKIPTGIVTDLLGKVRIHNTTVDIGAYEFGATSYLPRYLTINAVNGTVSTNPNFTNGIYNDGTSIELTATPASGYQFDGWSGDVTGTTNPLTITMDADKTVTAMFSAVTASVVDLEFNKEVKVYPIPATDILNIEIVNEYQIKKVVIYSLLGKKVIETKETKVNISELVNGVYLLMVTNEEGRVASRRIIKM
ncbi:hypothetical protein BTO06_04520 [Tenacibaculum sp. SZ-18]|uniref:InlB B-repeat-containing protein n=1 Tax=Tenacibaculum sp. SZ-18 TaxID=754423 RepID=UPI000C2CEDEE|nr:T9SS type A sorting domain-containing protein [Tenacibaculum sp. SZ-18]AUC14452.1 hypothetical protein BTO06_04520 [Tenacibaculum sp. SZ-18]